MNKQKKMVLKLAVPRSENREHPDDVEVAIAKEISIKQRTLRALELLGGIDRVVGRGEKVFIKPNIVDGAPFETGEVVQLEVVEALTEEAFGAGASQVIIGEVPTYWTPTETVKEYGRLAKKLGAEFLELDKHPFVKVKVEDAKYFEEVRLSKPFVDSDVFINVPTLKTHCSCGVTIAVKNMYGLVPRDDRRLYHSLNRVEEAIVDLTKARKADLIIVDGTYTTLHLGRRPLEDFKETFKLDLTLAGYDPIAIDTVGAKILGIDPDRLRFLRWGEEKGLGTRDLSQIKILGVPLEEACFGKAVDIVQFANNRTKGARILDYGACTGCLQLPLLIMRFAAKVLKERTLFVMGPGASANEVKKNGGGTEQIVLFGNCAAPTFYSELQGVFVPGCPPQPETLRQKIKELN